ncbi:GntR family transcriptional regulator [Nocardioides sp. cx-173]|uniref:GntR family transcriptional regulator n=1 Tax=Nocardioides sp. cx-173 TaxID=2898796 RepID=UPI001E2EAF6C|nr:GntR family transcriptional regulator [Nocardioides sp. cx-173]MCD4524034.1 GntR family transcriptional regulator [Nocardioides sp. cx-173]UGB41435.1 GntR family transcriptional regulator [Nocardioides sp. cx-173]
MEVAPGVDEVYRRILDRILSGYYPTGSRLPSCRALATELGSNSSTVDRAIGRLATGGRVRTVPRRGTFVDQQDGVTVDAREVVATELDEVLLRARRLGFTALELTGMVEVALDRVDSVRRIAVVECNERDLRHVQRLVQRASGVEVQPVLLAEAAGRVLDEEFDAVAVPIFHLNDIADLVKDLDQVVELNLVASPAALRRIIGVRDQESLVVVAPSARGVQWMTALVGQYYPGHIQGVELGPDAPDDGAWFEGEPVLVVNNAATLGPIAEAKAGQVIAIEWELDGRFNAALRARVENVISARAVVPGPGTGEA